MTEGAPNQGSRLQGVQVGAAADGRPVAFRPSHVITADLQRSVQLIHQLHGSNDAVAPQLAQLRYWTIDPPVEGGDDLTDDLTDDPADDPAGGASEGPHASPEDGAAHPYGASHEAPPGQPLDAGAGGWHLIGNVPEPEATVEHLRRHGITAHLNHAYWSHPSAVHPWPATPPGAPTPGPLYASPVYAHPLDVHPAYAGPPIYSPVYAHPVYAHPAYATPLQATDAAVPQSSALAARRGDTTDGIAALLCRPVVDGARVVVLDTGLIDPAQLAPELRDAFGRPGSIRPLRATDVGDEPSQHGLPLAPAAGHGTFIAGVIAQAAPGCRVFVGKVFDGLGIGDEWTIARRIHALTESLRRADHPERTILSLSFGSPTPDHPHLLAHVIEAIQALGVVVVASAGNDAMATPVYPAALPGVVAVGALATSGPAPFSNFGAWVNACAAGVDLVSAFFDHAHHADHADLPGQRFEGWAIWSGTSFSCPVVAGALAQRLLTDAAMPATAGAPAPAARTARERLIDSPWLMRVPGMGTVVNVF